MRLNTPFLLKEDEYAQRNKQNIILDIVMNFMKMLFPWTPAIFTTLAWLLQPSVSVTLLVWIQHISYHVMLLLCQQEPYITS